MFLSEEIKESYQSWENGDIVLITAPTGSGKSYFILHILLEWAVLHGQKILYLVNRKILKKQLECDVETVRNSIISKFGRPILMKDHIEIKTYQSIEQAILNNQFEVLNKLKEYSYVIYDECHYFYNDANFNTYTELSYDCMRTLFNDKIQVFMSATMNAMEEKIITRPAFLRLNEVPALNVQLKFESKRICRYACPVDYSYIKIHDFESEDDIKTIIKGGLNRIDSEKWLVFCDNIVRGKKLRKQLLEKDKDGKQCLHENEIIFIDADYENDDSATEVVEQLATKSSADKKVIITTAVMDNGISFHDVDLKNIIILADTQESFIQMLGRKRVLQTGETYDVNVYICRRSIGHFESRLANVDKTIDFYERYAEALLRGNLEYNPEQGNWYYMSPYLMARDGTRLYARHQQNFLDNILHNEQNYNSARQYAYSVQGVLAQNTFSIERLYALKAFYQKMIQAMDRDVFAFLEEQRRWINRLDCPIDFSDAEEFIEEEYRNVLIEYLEPWVGNKMDGKQNKLFKKNKELRDILVYFYKKKSDYTENELLSITKTTSSITPERFNECMKNASLDYRMKKPDKSHFIIEKGEN